jgi:hypothetical protein
MLRGYRLANEHATQSMSNTPPFHSTMDILRSSVKCLLELHHLRCVVIDERFTPKNIDCAGDQYPDDCE